MKTHIRVTMLVCSVIKYQIIQEKNENACIKRRALDSHIPPFKDTCISE